MIELTSEERSIAEKDAKHSMPAQTDTEIALAFVCKDHYHKTPKEIADKIRADNLEKAIAREYQAKLRAKEFKAKYTDAGFKIIIEDFLPIVFGETLTWSQKLVDSETGFKSPTLESILRTEAPELPNKLALDDPNTFSAFIAETCANGRFSFSWCHDRWSNNEQKDKFAHNRFFEAKIFLRMKSR